MKTLQLFAVLLLISFIARSQKNIEVETGLLPMSKGEQMAFSVLIPESKATDIEPIWKRYVNSRSVGERVNNLTTQIGNIFRSDEKDAVRDKLKVQKNGNELFVRAIKEMSLTKESLDIYALLTNQEDGCKVSTFFQYTDSVFINDTSADKEQIQNIRSYIRDFGVIAYREVVDEQINKAKKDAKEEENILKDLMSASRKEEKAIVSHETDIDELKAEIKTIENDISRLDEIIDEKKLNLEMLIKKSPEYDIAKKEIKELSKDKSKYFKKIKSCKTKIKSREMDISDSKDKIKQHKLQAEKQQELIDGKLKIVDLLIEKKAGIH